MKQQEADNLRDYYDKTSTAGGMDQGIWEDDVDPDPMVTTSLRLPKSLLDWVRTQAAAQRIKPTALIRQWIENQQAGTPDQIESRLEKLERAVFHQAS